MFCLICFGWLVCFNFGFTYCLGWFWLCCFVWFTCELCDCYLREWFDLIVVSIVSFSFVTDIISCWFRFVQRVCCVLWLVEFPLLCCLLDLLCWCLMLELVTCGWLIAGLCFLFDWIWLVVSVCILLGFSWPRCVAWPKLWVCVGNLVAFEIVCVY